MHTAPHREQKERTTMKSKKTRAATQALKGSKTEPQKRKLPIDPDGLFKRAAARGAKVIAMYDKLNPDLGRDYLVSNLIHDLMHPLRSRPNFGRCQRGICICSLSLRRSCSAK